MHKTIKIALAIIVSALVLLFLVIGIFAATFNPNDYKQTVIDLVQQKKQRTLHLDGDIKLAFWPKLGADLGKVSISEHNSDKTFASLNNLKVSVALLPLLRKELIVDTIYIDQADAHIVRYKDGSTNFDDLLSKDESESQQIKFDIDGVHVTDSSVSLHDEMTGKDYAINRFNLTTGHIALGSPFDIATDFSVQASSPAIKADAAIKGNVMFDPEARHFAVKALSTKIKGDVADIKQLNAELSGDVELKLDTMEIQLAGLSVVLQGERQGAKLEATVKAPALKVLANEVSSKQVEVMLSQVQSDDSIKASLMLDEIQGSPSAVYSRGIKGDVIAKQGKHQIATQFDSPFSADLEKMVFDLPKLAGQLQVKDPALPKGEMSGTYAFKLHADAKQERAQADYSLDIDRTHLQGDFSANGFANPDIRFNLTANQLDLNNLLGKPITESNSKPSVATNHSSIGAEQKAADLSALGQLKLQGKVSIGDIRYDKYQLRDLALNIKADGQRLDIQPLAVKLDASQIKGGVGVSRFSNPIYHFDIDIDRLDADQYMTQGESVSKSTPEKENVSSKPSARQDIPVDLSALKSLNADGQLHVGWLKLANVTSTNVRMRLHADQGVVELSPFSASLYEGSMNGALHVDARTIPVIQVKQEMKGISIGPLLTDAINNDMLNGKGNLSIDINTKGSTVNTLKQALNGKTAVNLTDGAVKGIDIAGTLRNVKDKLNSIRGQTSVAGDKTKKTDFSEMSASFNIKDGVARNDDLNMKAPLFRITGDGDIDIGRETLNYLVKPTVVNTLKGQGGADLTEMNGLTIPIKLTGTFAQPAYAIDFASLAVAVAKNKLLDGVGGAKGDAVRQLIGGENKEDALKSLLESKKKKNVQQSPTTTESTEGEAPAQAKPTPTPKEDSKSKMEKKLNKLLGF